MSDDQNSNREAFKNQQLQSAQTLITVALISAPVSLLFGGILLDIVAIVCACIARGKIKSVLAIEPNSAISLRLYKQSKMAIAFSVVACVVNLIFVIFMANYLYQMILSGDIDSYLESFAQGNLSMSPNNSSSIWD